MKFKIVLLITALLNLCVLLNTVFSEPIISHKSGSDKWVASNSVYVEQGETVKLKLNINTHEVADIGWYQIIPDISQYYKNANFPFEPDPYAWVGFAKIKYNTLEISEFRDQAIVEITPGLLQKNAPRNSAYYNSKLGSFWFQAKVTLKNGRALKSAGVGDNDRYGLSPLVFRVSYLEGRDYIGYLSSFYNVPGLFGSIPYQCENYIGVDCADVLMAVDSIIKQKKFKDYNVAMLVKRFDNIASFEVAHGNPGQKLHWEKDFHKGDFIVVKYSSSSQFAHIGMLYRDKNENGILDGEDLVMHAGPDALHVSTLDKGGFDGFVKILKNE